jgi:hypothetical protein
MSGTPATFTCKHVCAMHMNVVILLFIYLNYLTILSIAQAICHIAGLMAEI